MAHWRLTPKQVSELAPNEIEVMAFGYHMYERRQLEGFSDLIGTLTGTSWSVDALTAEHSNLEDAGFTWSKRPERQRVSLPLTTVVGGNKVVEHVKKVAQDMKSRARKDPSIVSLPSSSMLENTEIVDLSKVSKDDFLKFARGVRI